MVAIADAGGVGRVGLGKAAEGLPTIACVQMYRCTWAQIPMRHESRQDHLDSEQSFREIGLDVAGRYEGGMGVTCSFQGRALCMYALLRWSGDIAVICVHKAVRRQRYADTVLENDSLQDIV